MFSASQFLKKNTGTLQIQNRNVQTVCRCHRRRRNRRRTFGIIVNIHVPEMGKSTCLIIPDQRLFTCSKYNGHVNIDKIIYTSNSMELDVLFEAYFPHSVTQSGATLGAFVSADFIERTVTGLAA